jgi:hypothetical protein
MLLTSSTIIEVVKRECNSGLALMGYFYFDFKDRNKQSSRNLLTSLLSQLATESDLCSDFLSDLYLEHAAGSRQPSDSVLTKCLTDILRHPQQPTTYIILDALDECPNIPRLPTARDKVLDLLEELVGLNLSNLRICVTSRPEADIKAVLEPLTSLHVSIHDQRGQMQDIIDYINAFVHSDRRMRRWRLEDKQLVIDTLSAKADGM